MIQAKMKLIRREQIDKLNILTFNPVVFAESETFKFYEENEIKLVCIDPEVDCKFVIGNDYHIKFTPVDPK